MGRLRFLSQTVLSVLVNQTAVSEVKGASSSRHLACEGGGVDPALVLELEEQAVPAFRGELRREADRGIGGVFGGVGVEVAEVAGAERDEVAAGAEVGLGAH